ncbi:hypothetical protein C0J52_23150 [Blattella germanica]|nr:hypothetical protein C0J52_23150 [Blattella germanica]
MLQLLMDGCCLEMLIVNYTTGVPAKGIITLSILATPILLRPRSVHLVPHNSSTVLLEIRYDRKDHWPAKDSSQRKCANYHKAMTHICTKCNLALRIQCYPGISYKMIYFIYNLSLN